MGTILDQIAYQVKIQLEERKKKKPYQQMLSLAETNPKPASFRAAFHSKKYIISEIKFASPSKGQIRKDLDPVKVAKEYLENQAGALSILTERNFFHGSLEYLSLVRKCFPACHILQKDFFLDPYQILEAKIHGANAILLIVALLSQEQLRDFQAMAKDLGLEAIVEVHNTEEMEIAKKIGAEIIGINNRNLKTMKIDLNIGKELISWKEQEFMIAESGFSQGKDLRAFLDLGFDAFLIGSFFMEQANPGLALKKIMKECQA